MLHIKLRRFAQLSTPSLLSHGSWIIESNSIKFTAIESMLLAFAAKKVLV